MIIDFLRSLLYKTTDERSLKETVQSIADRYPEYKKWVKIALYTMVFVSMLYLSIAPIRLLLKNQYLPTFFMHHIALITPATIIMLTLNVVIDSCLHYVAKYVYSKPSCAFIGKYMLICIRTHLYSALGCLAFLAISFLLTL